MSKIPDGTIHKTPADVQAMLLATPKVLALWQDLTPLARNEWICWMTDGKKAETRTKRIAVGKFKMLSGMRRPCCWAGCPHRRSK